MDQFLNFIAIEDDMFILREYQSNLISYQGNNTHTHCPMVYLLLQTCCVALNRSNVSEGEIAGIIETIADSLFSTFVNLG